MNKLLALLLFATLVSRLAAGPTFTVDVAHPAGKVSPLLYGLMTEEINHSYDGGLYAELLQNRAFLDNPASPVHWSVVTTPGASATIALDSANGLNGKLTNSLRLRVTQADSTHAAGVANDGYWGIPVNPHTRYRARFFAKADAGFSSPITVSIVSDDGRSTYASGKTSGLSADWKEFELALQTARLNPTTKGRLQLSLQQPGTVWLGFVSLFPPTWNDRPNGLRKDLMQMLVDLNPQFLRFPGGNYLEGDTLETRFQWKKTLGPVEQRPGHPCPWGYRSTDGMGLLEFLCWCEDMRAEPVLAVYAGYSLKGMHVTPGPDLEPHVQEALQEIEYVIGDLTTTWGAQRAKNGHPAPFKLSYVEIGNEDWFDKSNSYNDRFRQFHDAIKARYPQLKTISTIANDQPKMFHLLTCKPDVLDEHYYRSAREFLRMSPDYAVKYDRAGPEIFVGEWAAYEDPAIKPWEPGAKQQPPTPAMKAALGDAAFMAAMERNSDLIRMQCYAPLFVNVSPGARQWRPNLIGYDGLTSYGSPSYFAIKMFSRNLGDQILRVETHGTSVQGAATRLTETGEIILKLVNPEPRAEPLQIKLNGIRALDSAGAALSLIANPEVANSLERPRTVVPASTKVRHVAPDFTYTLPSCSVVVLKLKPRS